MKALLGSFDNTQVAVLQTSFDRACKELGIATSDEKGRTRIARAVMDLAAAGQYDPDRLRVYAISRFRTLESIEAIGRVSSERRVFGLLNCCHQQQTDG